MFPELKSFVNSKTAFSPTSDPIERDISTIGLGIIYPKNWEPINPQSYSLKYPLFAGGA